MILVDAAGVGVSRPDRPLFADLSVTIATGDRLGVVGINGTGKSTLLRVLAGEVDPESGVVRRGRGTRVSFLGQHPVLPPGTVRQSALSGLPDEAAWQADAVLDHLGMSALAGADVGTLSGGQAKRVALARALLACPGDHEADLLILDEPTNHLDLDAIEWLEQRLARQRGGLVIVTHDRHLLGRVATTVLELDRGRAYLHEGGYAGYLEGRSAREERLAAEESSRRNLARHELAWLQRGAPARTRKPKAHVDAARRLVETRAEAPARRGGLELGAATARSGEGQGRSPGSQGSYRGGYDARVAPRLGTKVVELHGVGHGYGPTSLFDGIDWALQPGERYGIVGPNGAGKSTLLDIIAGRTVPRAGRVETGPTVRLGYYDQTGRTLDPDQRVRDAVAGPSRVPGTPEDNRLMEQFWFDSDAQFAPVGTLSGGERRRLQLLLVLAERPNVLLLDEPTNDLDLDTLRAVEEFLDGWPGTLVVVSHDRTFLDRTVEEVLLVEDGRAALVAGGYAGWRAARDAGGAPRPLGRSAPERPAAAKPAARREGGPSASTLRQRMKEAEKEVERLGRDRDRLTEALHHAGADHQELARLGEQLADVVARIDAAELRWLEAAEELG